MSEHLFDLFRLELLADLAPEYLGKANPKLDGCFAVVEALYEKLSETMDANIKNKMQTL